MQFTKEILRPGRYLVLSGDGKRKEEVFTGERLKGFARKFGEMKSKGLLVPSPWQHDGSAPVTTADAPKVYSSKNNAGFWEDLIYDDAQQALYGKVEVPDSEDAKKVGTSIREVSPHIARSWRDGSGNLWEDAILHVAFVQHPVSQGQENFKPVVKEQDEYAVAMSTAIDLATGSAKKGKNVAASSATVQDALKALEANGICLPQDTTPENLIERIVVACYAIANSEDADNNDEDQELKPSAIAMSTQPPVVTPAVAPPAAGALPQAIPVADEVKLALADPAKNPYIVLATAEAKKGYQRRADALGSRGAKVKEVVKAKIQPLIDSFSLSLGADGKPVPNALDTVLEGLEAMPDSRGSFLNTAQDGAPEAPDEEAVELPNLGDVARGGKELQSAVDEQLRMAGRLPQSKA